MIWWDYTIESLDVYMGKYVEGRIPLWGGLHTQGLYTTAARRYCCQPWDFPFDIQKHWDVHKSLGTSPVLLTIFVSNQSCGYLPQYWSGLVCFPNPNQQKWKSCFYCSGQVKRSTSIFEENLEGVKRGQERGGINTYIRDKETILKYWINLDMGCFIK